MQVFFFKNIWSLYTRCAVPCLSHDCAQEVSRDQANVLLFLYCDQGWYSVTVGSYRLVFDSYQKFDDVSFF